MATVNRSFFKSSILSPTKTKVAAPAQSTTTASAIAIATPKKNTPIKASTMNDTKGKQNVLSTPTMMFTPTPAQKEK